MENLKSSDSKETMNTNLTNLAETSVCEMKTSVNDSTPSEHPKTEADLNLDSSRLQNASAFTAVTTDPYTKAAQSMYEQFTPIGGANQVKSPALAQPVAMQKTESTMSNPVGPPLAQGQNINSRPTSLVNIVPNGAFNYNACNLRTQSMQNSNKLSNPYLMNINQQAQALAANHLGMSLQTQNNNHLNTRFTHTPNTGTNTGQSTPNLLNSIGNMSNLGLGLNSTLQNMQINAAQNQNNLNQMLLNNNPNLNMNSLNRNTTFLQNSVQNLQNVQNMQNSAVGSALGTPLASATCLQN